MLFDFVFASVLAFGGVLSLMTAAADTLALNRELEAQVIVSNALANFSAMHRLQSKAYALLPVKDLCGVTAISWQREWCSTLLNETAHVADKPLACLVPSGIGLRLHVAWDGALCGTDTQPQREIDLP